MLTVCTSSSSYLPFLILNFSKAPHATADCQNLCREQKKKSWRGRSRLGPPAQRTQLHSATVKVRKTRRSLLWSCRTKEQIAFLGPVLHRSGIRARACDWPSQEMYLFGEHVFSRRSIHFSFHLLLFYSSAAHLSRHFSQNWMLLFQTVSMAWSYLLFIVEWQRPAGGREHLSVA